MWSGGSSLIRRRCRRRRRRRCRSVSSCTVQCPAAYICHPSAENWDAGAADGANGVDIHFKVISLGLRRNGAILYSTAYYTYRYTFGGGMGVGEYVSRRRLRSPSKSRVSPRARATHIIPFAKPIMFANIHSLMLRCNTLSHSLSLSVNCAYVL